ncbi:uncharacterized protein LOC142239997 [Haematobia irritans]|uniref:uncharacterized protein LOC142239997 n=1 Tax=Haematobia irritans TaxID=7368 RepID=UPI003F50A7D3
MTEILNVSEKPFSDENITKKDYHSYVPYIRSFKNNDEIRITIQNQDLYVLPAESYIYIEGTITVASGERAINARLKNNCVAHMFDEIRYELNGVEIDRSRYLGISSTIKNFASLTSFESNMLLNAGWSSLEDISVNTFNFYVPLKMLLGFAEDFHKIILHSKHDLILLRSSSDSQACYSSDPKENLNLTITNVMWRIPHVHLSDIMKVKVMKTVRDGTSLPIAFRSWDCHFNPTFFGSMKCNWNVKLSLNRERPRFILFAFVREGKFAHCNLTNIKVHLNSETYPYDDLNLKFDENRYAILYEMYTKFQENYYQRESYPILSLTKFKESPIIVIDVSHQNEMIKHGPIDVKLEIETSKLIPQNTHAYCLILHDRLMEYTPLTAVVRKII